MKPSLKFYFPLFIFAIACSQSFAQSVGISSTTISPDPDAVLEVRSTTKGVLLPRLTLAQRGTYTAAANSNTGLAAGDGGMTIFNTTSNTYNYWDGGQWLEMQTTAGTSGVFVENQNTVDQAADFRISGNGTVQTALGVGALANGSTSRVLIHDASGTANELQFLVRDNASLPIFSVLDLGRVGVGTNAPTSMLDLRSEATSGADDIMMRITKNSNVAGELVGIGMGSQVGSHIVKSAMVHERINANGTGKLHFLVDNATDANDVSTTETRMTIDQNGNVGIGVTAPTSKLEVDGNVTLTGKLNSNGIQESSDRRFKREIEPLANSLLNVLSLEGVSYKWKRDEFPERGFTDRLEIGVIAQDLEKIYPELVSTDAKGYKSVQYSHIVPVLIEAIKEQQKLIGTLEADLSSIKEEYSVTSGKYDEIKELLKSLEAKVDRNAQSFDAVGDEINSLSGAIYGDSRVE